MPNYQDRLFKYCSDVQKGIIKSGKYTRLAIKRFLTDIKRQKDDSFDWEYIPEFADEVMEFAELINIPDIERDDGSKNLLLLDWHIFIYSNIFGWRYKSNPNKRRFRLGYVEVARKNSKTTSILFPFILWDFLVTPAAEAYFVSKAEEQSKKSFEELTWIIKNNPDFKGVESTYAALTYSTSKISFFSSESTGVDAYKNSMTIIDEYHAYSSDKIVNAFRKGGRAKLNNLTLMITSAGNDISGPCFAENERCKKILDGIFTEESYFGIIYSYDDTDDWQDPSNLIKANPALGQGFLDIEILKTELRLASSKPSDIPDFKAKTCGIWTHSLTSWIPLDKWDSCFKTIPDITGAPCFGAFDLSKKRDFTAWTLYFKVGNEYVAKHRFWIPEDTVQERFKNENINIYQWIEDGILTAIPGSSIDFDRVFDDIAEDIDRYKPSGIHFDRWFSSEIVEKLNSTFDDICIPFNQNLAFMSSPTKSWENNIYEGKIIDTSPIMRWMVPLAEIKPDVNGNYKPLKPDERRNTRRIDGVITSIMALDGLLNIAPSVEIDIEDILALF